MSIDNDFFIACCNGEISIAKELCLLGADPSFDNDKSLRWATTNNKFDIVKWLLSLDCVDPKSNNSEAFLSACYSKSFDIMKLLHSRGCRIENVESFHLYFQICNTGFIEEMKEIYKLYIYDIVYIGMEHDFDVEFYKQVYMEYYCFRLKQTSLIMWLYRNSLFNNRDTVREFIVEYNFRREEDILIYTVNLLADIEDMDEILKINVTENTFYSLIEMYKALEIN